MEVIKFILLATLAIAVVVAIIAGWWWVILWSFNFPIVFAWKQLIGVVLVLSTLAGSQLNDSAKSE